MRDLNSCGEAGGHGVAPSRLARLRILAIIMLVAAGCGPSGPAVGRVSGQVTYQGKPVPNATVTFLPSGEGSQAAVGITDSSGNYQLSTFGKNDGALVGSHKVSVVARAAYEGKLPEGAGEALLEELQTQGKAAIPERYFNTDTSGLTYEVKPGTNAIDLPLADG